MYPLFRYKLQSFIACCWFWLKKYILLVLFNLNFHNGARSSFIIVLLTAFFPPYTALNPQKNLRLLYFICTNTHTQTALHESTGQQELTIVAGNRSAQSYILQLRWFGDIWLREQRKTNSCSFRERLCRHNDDAANNSAHRRASVPALAIKCENENGMFYGHVCAEVIPVTFRARREFN